VSSIHYSVERYLIALILDQAAQDKVRDKAQGRGLLYPDTFSEDRLLFLPPAASVLLILYSRNHNVSSLPDICSYRH
jgi:hypothetical protein